MTAQKHTPGPWVLGKPGRDGEDIHMCVVMTAYASGEHAKSYDVICECRQGSSVRIPLDQKIANARLISAAPDMLEALYEAEEYFYNHSDADHDETGFVPNKEMKLLTVVRAAVAKATRQ